MKKLFLLLLCIFPIFIYAEETNCSYSKQVSLQTLAVHVNYSYEYSESGKTFSIVFNNVVDGIILTGTNANIKIKEDNKVVVQYLKPGSTFVAYINGSNDSGCGDITLRTIRINLPYVNPYYNTSACKGYEELAVCKSRFLDYEVTSSIFNRSVQNYKSQKQNEDKEVKEKTLFEDVITFTKKYYIEILLVLMGTVPTILIGNSKLRKARHGF